MIRGSLNERLDPLVTVEILNGDGQHHPVEALLDTGFSGYLTLPPDAVACLGLKHAKYTSVTMANGQEIQASIHMGAVKWLGRIREIEIVATDSPSLLGMSLLAGCKITIRAHPGGEILIEEDRET